MALGERGLDVGRHVVRAFRAVAVERRVLGHELVQEGFQIALDVRIGVLLDDQRGRGVAQEQGEQPLAQGLGGEPGGDLAGDLGEAPARRVEC